MWLTLLSGAILWAPALALAALFPAWRAWWCALVLPAWLFGSWLLWLREVRTSGSFGQCDICTADGASDVSRTTRDVDAAHQLAHVQHSIRALVARYAPRHLVVAGHSAGGHLAALVGVMSQHDIPSVPRISVVGISGVYDIARLWRESVWPVREWCIRPAFGDTPAGHALSAHDLLSRLTTESLSWAVGAPRLRFHLISARHDNEMLTQQADDFGTALKISGVGVSRHRGVGFGHGVGLIRSQELVDLLAAIANAE
jgi:acetyl esterase/lipase